ncbi:hypothetical protein [Paenibacillus kobensis]|uniref:hypothetical protein n=1 Tax=Paenibacillus kobensis TaxID=59841 RepID=UPI000FD7B412|nr:hypothetical protein [Paenibacillus kobensis]
MRWAKFTTVTVSSLLLLYVLAWSTGGLIRYEKVEPTAPKYLLFVALYIVIFVLTVRAIARSRQAKLTYLLLAQNALCLAAFSVVQDIFRGWYVWMKGDSTIYIGWFGEAEDPKILYDEIGLLSILGLPVPEWNWSVLLGTAVLLAVLAAGWFVKTIRRKQAGDDLVSE